MQTITIDTDKLKQGTITVSQPAVFNFISGGTSATSAINVTSGNSGLPTSTLSDYWVSRRETEKELARELCAKTRRVKRIKCVSEAFKEAQIAGFERDAEITLSAVDKLNGRGQTYASPEEFSSVLGLINARRYNRDRY